MAKSYFRQQALAPNAPALEDTLGACYPLWANFVKAVEKAFPTARA